MLWVLLLPLGWRNAELGRARAGSRVLSWGGCTQVAAPGRGTEALQGPPEGERGAQSPSALPWLEMTTTLPPAGSEQDFGRFLGFWLLHRTPRLSLKASSGAGSAPCSGWAHDEREGGRRQKLARGTEVDKTDSLESRCRNYFVQMPPGTPCPYVPAPRVLLATAVLEKTSNYRCKPGLQEKNSF